MPEEERPHHSQAERSSQDQSPRGSARSNGSDERSDCCDDWRCCEPPPYCGPPPPYWDPCWGPHPYHRPHYYHGRHDCWPAPPGSEWFEAMWRFAASAAGARGRWWRSMADAARYARRDYCDPYCDPCPPPWSNCDPCAPYPPYCDPCPPPWPHCDPCPPPYGRRGACEAPDPIKLKALRETLENDRDDKLRKKREELQRAETSEDKIKKELAEERAKLEAVVDAVIHDVKLARVAEAMRRKQWSRWSSHGRPC
jgi:hypothetical protein